MLFIEVYGKISTSYIILPAIDGNEHAFPTSLTTPLARQRSWAPQPTGQLSAL
jgi:hypothetical protein